MPQTNKTPLSSACGINYRSHRVACTSRCESPSFSSRNAQHHFTLVVTASTTKMASVDYVPLTTREAFSGILGSVSLACWIFLLVCTPHSGLCALTDWVLQVPQLVENYRNGSAEAISLGFIFIWFLGDVCNLIGAAWAGLVPVVIAIAIYFCFADGVLISQCLYYNIVNKRKDAEAVTVEPEASEEEPLLARTRSGSLTIPGSRRRSNTASLRRRSSGQQSTDVLLKIMEEDETSGRLWLRNTISVLAVIAAGSAGWALAWQSGAWKPTPEHQDSAEEHVAVGAQVLGYASAVAYLGARIPQIIKNWREKSCEGRDHPPFVRRC